MDSKEAPKGKGSDGLEFRMSHNGISCGFADAETMERFKQAIIEAQQMEIGHLHLIGADKPIQKKE
jgi:hypothetical protein